MTRTAKRAPGAALSLPDTVLSGVRVVLYEPQDPVNIAATIRAMKNMGCSDLYLVRSVEYDPWRLEGIAHDTGDIIERIRNCDSIEEALDGCVRVAGFTARRRAAKRDVTTPRVATLELLDFAREGPVALLFGREDKGLPNEILDRAHIVVTIPTTDHASLNLAQAVLIALYELHLSAADATRTLAPPRKDAPPATAEEYEKLFADTERALYAIEFFKTRFHEHIMRSVRTLFYRAAPDSRELALLRAIFIEVIRTIDRITKGKAGGLQQ
ncbi:MAG: tRNA (cytidine32/uridine32-2-O)-methyltransferase [Gemmatimonadaceae bacterium]|nr:tRNA (cytidine32/uridine32-2-O)-methyltransferase [Gemmatimonadaceae bacterium]